MSFEHATDNERLIVNKLVEHALASGYLVSLNDGEEWVVKLSADRDAILAACASTGSDMLSFRDPQSPTINAAGHFKRVGTVTLIYGNDADVISDYSSADLDAFSAWMKPVEDFAETLA